MPPPRRVCPHFPCTVHGLVKRFVTRLLRRNEAVCKGGVVAGLYVQTPLQSAQQEKRVSSL